MSVLQNCSTLENIITKKLENTDNCMSFVEIFYINLSALLKNVHKNSIKY